MFPRQARAARAVFAIVVGALIAFLISHTAPFRLLENAVYDWRVTFFSPIAPANVVIVGIDDDAFAQIRADYPEQPCRAPINKTYLAKLITHIDEGGPAAIGLDYLLDEWVTEQERATFIAAMDALDAPLVGITTKVTPETVADQPFDGPVWSDPGLVRDRIDRVVRRYDPQPEELPAFAAALAAANGAAPPTEPFHMAYYVPEAHGLEAFAYFPAEDAMAAPSRLFRNKTVLIGRVSAASLTTSDWDPLLGQSEDRHLTPLRVSGAYGFDTAGVEVHAHAIANMMRGDAIDRQGALSALLWALGAAIVGVLAAGRLERWWVIALVGAGWVLGVFVAASLAMQFAMTMTPVIAPLIAGALSFGLYARLNAGLHKAERARLRSAFGRYVAPSVIERAVDGAEAPETLSLKAETRPITFIVTDIASFSTFVGGVERETFAKIMNAYFECVVEVLWSYEATVDKLVGDGIYAFFGAPTAQDDHARRAVECARAIDRAAERFCERVRADYGVDFGHTRIGVATGDALVGNFGGDRRVNYTAYGECVVVAARLQDANKQFGTRILMDGVTAASVDPATVSGLGPVELKGVAEPVEGYTLVVPTDTSA